MNDPKDNLILIVEDDESVAEFIKFTIENEGFRSIGTDNGENVLDLVKQNKPTLIILDMMLPGMKGIEVLKMLQEEKFHYIPVVILSGKFKVDFLWKMVQFESNVKECMVKPINVERLIEIVHSILKTSKSA